MPLQAAPGLARTEELLHLGSHPRPLGSVRHPSSVPDAVAYLYSLSCLAMPAAPGVDDTVFLSA